MRPPHIALDFTSLDNLKISNGQYRYVVDLVHGLMRISLDARFTLLGSRAAPVEELRDDLARDRRWRYVQLSHTRIRGGDLVDHVRYSAVLAGLRVDVLHALHMFIPALAPCRVVVTEHDLMFDIFDEYADHRKCREYKLYRRAVRKANRIIAISRTTADDLVRLHGLERSRIDVVYHGSAFCDTTAEAPDHSSEKYGACLLSPYNLEPRKNIRMLLKAFSKLRKQFPDLKLMLFGKAAWTAEREQAFEGWLSEEGLRPGVERIGFVDDEKLKGLYRSCRLFVFPSLYEGFGLPLLEAMASGACVVARNASAMAEIVQRAGVLVDTTDAEAFAEGMARVLRDTPLEQRLRNAARERAQQFSIGRMAVETVKSYYCALQLGLPPAVTQHLSEAALERTTPVLSV